MRCIFCRATEDLEERATTQHGRIAACRDERACVARLSPLLARALAERERPRK